MLVDDVLKCSFSSWFSILGHLSIESDIIEIDDKFREYLLSDGIILPECCNSESYHVTNGNGHNQNGHSDDHDDDNGIDWDDNHDDPSDNNEEINVIEFPQIEKRIRRSLRRYGNLFPKLNWSSCEDASWVQANGTKCSDLTSVFLMLKSSDKIVHDLIDPFDHCSDFDCHNPPKFQYQLILRKWINMNPSMEFRCFIGNQTLLAICQRDVRTFYEYIGSEKSQIIQDIQNFFEENIRGKFPLDNFVIDILRPTIQTIQLIDVNVFGELTDSLLFDWDELLANASAVQRGDSIPEFRYIENRFGVQRGRFELNSLPLDVFNGNLTNLYDDNLTNVNNNDVYLDMENDDEIDSIYEQIKNESQSITPDKLEEFLSDLTEIIKNITISNVNMANLTYSSLLVVDNLLGRSETWLNMTNVQRLKSSDKVLNLAENLALLMNKKQEEEPFDDRPIVVIECSNVLLHSKYSTLQSNQSLMYELNNTRLSLPSMSLSSNSTDKISISSTASLVNSKNLISQICGNDTMNEFQLLNTPIVSMVINDDNKTVHFPEPHYFNLETTNYDRLIFGDKPTCYYWNITEKCWSTEGCYYRKIQSNRSASICECNHLTSIVIIVDIYGRDGDDQIKTWLTRITSTITILSISSRNYLLIGYISPMAIIGIGLTWFYWTETQVWQDVLESLCGRYL
ncbi:uncharacterized protein LOC124498536 isoform X1 [Dermatophagoides farinae]|uniref:uncharacterized protein LOC124498536 isoform X1 n=1 Tax=Dermatophagoides farinae TaxID=6954 RepID=UPI003F60BF11